MISRKRYWHSLCRVVYNDHVPSDSAASCQDRIASSVLQAKAALTRLDALLPSQSQQGGNSSGSHPGSKPPWHPAAASLIFELRKWARQEEMDLKAHLGLPPRDRGSSDANTLLALDSVWNLGSSADGERGFETARWLERWNSRAARVLGEASEIKRLPRQPGEAERPCPFCACLTLRYWALHGVVRCVNPGCRDQDGNRPSAKIEWSDFTRQAELVWHDGVSGLPALPQQGAA